MTAVQPGWRFASITIALTALLALMAVQVSMSPKVGFYLDELERTGLLYVLGPAVFAGLFLVRRFPRLSLYAMIFLVPFNTVGGTWGDSPAVTMAKILLTAGLCAAVLSTALAREPERAWMFDTALGQALLLWTAVVAVAILIGFVSTPNRNDWARESYWMLFYFAALPAGTLVRTRRELWRLVACGAAGAVIMQAIGFWLLATGHRYNRIDFVGGQGFFRAPFPALSALFLYLAAALFLFDSAERGLLSRLQRIGVLVALIAFVAGVLATMGRGLWISVALGMLPLLALVPWTRRTLRAALVSGAALVAAVGIVVAIDSLSEESRGNWTSMAWDFLLALDDSKAATTAGRALEWTHALDVWKRSPVVGLGFGYPYPDNPYDIQQVDAFYMHNSYMNILGKAGLLGLVAVLAVFALAFRAAAANARNPRAHPLERALAAAIAASLAQMVVVGLFVPLVTTTDAILGLAIEIGLVAAHCRLLTAAITE